MHFLERMFLRDYAVIERIQTKQTYKTNLHFAALSTSVWLFAVVMTFVNLISLVFRAYIPTSLNLLSASMPVALVEISIIVFGTGMYVDRIANRHKSNRPSIVDGYKSRKELFIWWVTTLSIFPIAAINAVILARFFGRI
jgi:uncharacterized membrane-anchored protein